MRRLDPFDYAVVCVLTILVYLHLPWRPTIRHELREVGFEVARLRFVLTSEVLLAALVLASIGILVYLVEVLPKRD